MQLRGKKSLATQENTTFEAESNRIILGGSKNSVAQLEDPVNLMFAEQQKSSVFKKGIMPARP
jgi:hypothetical protein